MIKLFIKKNITESSTEKLAEIYPDVWGELAHINIKPPEDMKIRLQKRLQDVVSPMTVATRSYAWYYFTAAATLLIVSLCSWHWYNSGTPAEAARIHAQTTIPKNLLRHEEIREMVKKIFKDDIGIIAPSATTLLSCKVSKLNHMVVPQMLYQYQGVPISLFLWDTRWPGAYRSIPKNLGHPVVYRRRGQTIIIWENDRLLHCLVSSLDAGELAAIFGLPTELDHPT